MNCTICFENTGRKKAIAKRDLVSHIAAHRREDFKKKLAQLPKIPDDIGVASSSRDKGRYINWISKLLANYACK